MRPAFGAGARAGGTLRCSTSRRQQSGAGCIAGRHGWQAWVAGRAAHPARRCPVAAPPAQTCRSRTWRQGWGWREGVASPCGRCAEGCPAARPRSPRSPPAPAGPGPADLPPAKGAGPELILGLLAPLAWARAAAPPAVAAVERGLLCGAAHEGRAGGQGTSRLESACMWRRQRIGRRLSWHAAGALTRRQPR